MSLASCTRRRSGSAVRLGAALLGACAVFTARADDAHVVKDPYFGEALFHFFQEDYFSALTHLMTSQHFARMPRHRDEAELLRGGMLLSYGLHAEAGRVFQALIDAGAPEPVRNRAWFYLAKIRSQRGYSAEAEEALARVTGPLPGELEGERLALHAMLLLRRDDYAQAAALLRRIPAASAWGAYARYNLGVALVRLGNSGEGEGLLDEIGREGAAGEARRTLRDQANVALAYASLRGGAPARAESYLLRVRLDGLLSNKALLGLGWARAELGEYRRALVPWAELSARSPSDAAVQESLLALPYALGRLGAYGQSLARYEGALDLYTREIVRLDEAMVAIRRGALVETLLKSNPGEGSGWLWTDAARLTGARVSRLPDTHESRYLAELLASQAFQESLKNYRDLDYLRRNLEGWARSIAAYRTMLATRQQGFAERLPRVVAGERGVQLERLRRAYAAEERTLERVEREEDAAALADARELGLQQRLDRVRAAVPGIADPAEREAVQGKYRRLQGVLTWELSARYAERLWERKKALRETVRLIEAAETRREALRSAQSRMPERFAEFDRRIEALSSRVDRLRTGVDVALREEGHHLAAVASAELARRREQIDDYIAQARFAVAQIYDQSLAAEGKTP